MDRFTMIHVLYPSSPFDDRIIDEEYRSEFELMLGRGITTSLFSFDELAMGDFACRTTRFDGRVIYRGWMLTAPQYQLLYHNVNKRGGIMTTPEEYLRCHYLPGWYDVLSSLTPTTHIVSIDHDFDLMVSQLNWGGYFVKDYVKSLTTSRGSITRNANEIREVIKLLAHYRGALEGGICIREFEQLLPNTEERYFVRDGVPYSRDNNIPDIIHQVVGVIDSPFYSIDVIQNVNGVLRIMELGDGQVSDKKKWTHDAFIKMLAMS